MTTPSSAVSIGMTTITNAEVYSINPSDITDFLRGHSAAAQFFSLATYPDADEEVELDKYEWAEGEEEKLNEVCITFIRENAADLLEYAATIGSKLPSIETGGWEMAGHDFWLTREEHGAGFWDRNLGELGDRLTEASKEYGGLIHLYLGDDGLIYTS